MHLARERVLLISGGEGSGKSLVTAAEIVARLGTWRLCYLVAPKYDSAHKEFDYIVDMLQRIGALTSAGISRPRNGKAFLTTRDGARLETISSEDGTKSITGTGESPDLLAMVEAGKQSYDIYLACRARISRSRGTLIMSGTIEQSERWYPELTTCWQADNPEHARSFIIPTWSNTVLYPGGESDPEIVQLRIDYPHDQFLERFGAVPCPPSNLVFKEFSHLTHVFDWCAYDNTKPTEIWIDPGYSGSHYAVEFVQFHPRAETCKHIELPDVSLTDVWVIGELYLDHAVHEEVVQQAQMLPYWSSVKSAVGDVVMQTHPMAGESPASVWQARAGLYPRGQRVLIADGINRHGAFLRDPGSGSPRLFFNPSCKGALHEYGSWKRKRVGEGLYSDPEDKNCDALKAINYGLIDRFGSLKERGNEKPVPLTDPYAFIG